MTNLAYILIKRANNISKNKTEFTAPKYPAPKAVNTGADQGKLPQMPYNPTSNARAIEQAQLSSPKQPVVVGNLASQSSSNNVKTAAGKLTPEQLNELLPTDYGVLRTLGKKGMEYQERRNAIAKALAESIGSEEQGSYALEHPWKHSILHSGLGMGTGAILGGILGKALAKSNAAGVAGLTLGGGLGGLLGNIYARNKRWNLIKKIKEKYNEAEDYDPEKIVASKDIGTMPYNQLHAITKLQVKDLLRKALKEDVDIKAEYARRFGDPFTRRAATVGLNTLGATKNNLLRYSDLVSSLGVEPYLARTRARSQGLI